jgi:integral membrane protein
MIKIFRILSIAEGYSFLLLLFVTMPLKYLGSVGLPNTIVGMAHGFLFIAYVIMAIVIGQILKWNLKDTVIVVLMSVVPFGTFWMKDRYLAESRELSA